LGHRNRRRIFNDCVTLCDKFIWNGGCCNNGSITSSSIFLTRFARQSLANHLSSAPARKPSPRHTQRRAASCALAGASKSNVKVVLERSASSGGIEDELITMFTTDGIHVEIEQGDKNLSKQVLDIQSQNPGSWIVSGSKMRSGLIRSVLGSFTDNIARQAIGPIVVVPDPKLTRQRKRSAHNATRDLAVSQ